MTSTARTTELGLDRLAHVDRAVVDHQVRAQPLAERGLVGSARHRDDPGAQCLAELDGRRSRSPRRAEHEEGLARREPAPRVQADPTRVVRDVEPGGITVAHRRRDRVEVGGRSQRLLGQPAAAEVERRHPEDPLADQALVDPGADGRHGAAHLLTRRERQLRGQRVHATAHERVGQAERRGPHVEAHESLPGLGGLELDELEHVEGFTGTSYLPGAHGPTVRDRFGSARRPAHRPTARPYTSGVPREDETERAVGQNAWLVDEMYERYLADPSAVSASWQEFFEDYGRVRPVAPAPTERSDAPATAAPTTAPPTEAAPTEAEGEIIRGAGARIVANMEASLAVPTATSFREVPARLLEVNRTIINGYLGRTRGGKVSYTHLIGYAVVRAIADSVPVMNASFAPTTTATPA